MTTRSIASDSKSSITSVSKKSSAFKGHSRSLVSSASRDVTESRVSGDDENDDLLSDYTSETTFFDEGQQAPSTGIHFFDSLFLNSPLLLIHSRFNRFKYQRSMEFFIL